MILPSPADLALHAQIISLEQPGVFQRASALYKILKTCEVSQFWPDVEFIVPPSSEVLALQALIIR